MSSQNSRLLELIEYVQQTAQLGSKVVSDIKIYQPNLWREDDFTDLPGIDFNQEDSATDDIIWLKVERLRESTAPLPDDELVWLWLQRSDEPGISPTLKKSVAASSLLSLLPTYTLPEGLTKTDRLLLADFVGQVQLEAAFKLFYTKKWVPWAQEEAKVRKTIAIYSRLFALQQQLEMGTSEKPLELLWGVGMALVYRPKSQLDIYHPLLVRGVEIGINPENLAIEVRPREMQARVELRCFSEEHFPGVLEVEKSGKNIYAQQAEELSPFERTSFEPLLQVAVAQLDARGSYLPDRVSAKNRLLPTATADLQVTDTWVLFARPRGSGMLTEDLERFKKQLSLQGEDTLPAAVLALVTEPATEQSAHKPLANYRGLSLVGGQAVNGEKQPVRELYFPLPFNDEQVQIIQRLDGHDGVVVQGPPGTGKTHTIANIICHYMALGKRVLVTSLKDQALSVVQDKLPPEIRKLAVSLLTSEAEGMKQFSSAITTLAAGIQSTNRAEAEQEITQFGEDLNRLHGSLARIDRELAEWAARNTDPLQIEGETLTPLEAAEQVIAGEGLYEWLTDELTLDPAHDAQLTDESIDNLRKARQAVGVDLTYLGATLPDSSKLPDAERIGQLHSQIMQLRQLRANTGSPAWASHMTGDEEGLQRLQQLLLGLQAEQAHLLAGPSWIRDWLGLTQVNPSECRTTVQPTFAALPDGQQFAQLHRQLIQYDALRAEFAASGVPALSLEGNATAPELQRLVSELGALQTLQTKLLKSADWVWALLLRYRAKNQPADFALLQELGNDVAAAQLSNDVFLRRPVQGVETFLPGSELFVALENLAADKPPFGVIGRFVPFSNKKEKAQLDRVRILVSSPASAQDWAHVRDFVMHQQQLQELVLRWQILVPRLGLPTAADFDMLAQAYGQYQEVLAYLAQEDTVRRSLCQALPGWPTEHNLDAPTAVAEAVAVVQRHLTRLSLHGVHAVRTAAQAALEHTAGNLTLALRLVLRDYVGNSAAEEVELQKTWSELLSELHHAQGRETAFNEHAALAQERLIALFPAWPKELAFTSPARLTEALQGVQQYLYAVLVTAGNEVEDSLHGTDGPISKLLQRFFSTVFGKADLDEAEIMTHWSSLLAELQRIEVLAPNFETVTAVTQSIAKSGAFYWSEWLCTSPFDAETVEDELLPAHWRKAWRLKRLAHFVDSIDARAAVRELTKQRRSATNDLAKIYQKLIAARTWHRLAENATPAVRSGLQAFLTAMGRIGKTGRGKKASAARIQARQAAELAQPAIPCWILPHYRVSEALPTEFGSFDLVIIDEASQSDLSALPALLRAKKLLVVGDDKQVSPAAVGMNIEEVQQLMLRTLPDAISVFKPLFSPDRSIYDLCKVVFADTALMLREHFRCVAPIIEYSKRQYYNHELRPLRYPKASERLDPPLIDVLVADGCRRQDINPGEAKFIVDEICAITQLPEMANRTIGVISLTQNKQAYYIWEQLQRKLTPDIILRHRIACGDAATFQGNERDIVFLSMLVSKDDSRALSGTMYEQRFNVAASRARDRLYLVRSMQYEELSVKDLRRTLVAHFQAPFQQEKAELVAGRRNLCESDFEREVFDELVTRGYRVRPQVRVGSYRIDMVVEGDNDERLAIECDGDRFHGPAQWESDMRRQRILERAGWEFWRCFASTFIRYRADTIKSLESTLQARGIMPLSSEDVPTDSSYVEFRRVVAFEPVLELN